MSLTLCPVGHVICPYNKSHVIRTERIQFHLTKCQPNAGDKPFAVCPFNSTHLIPSSEINNHKLNLCPDRNKLETFLYEVADTKPLFPVNNIEIASEENWDDAVEHSYDPEKLLNNKKLLVLKQVAPPAERKKFHAEQRKKFQMLSDEPISVAKNNQKLRQPNSKPITRDSPKKVEIKKETVEELKPVVEKIENLTIAEQKKTDEFELVVGKKKNKKTNGKSSAVNQKEAVKNKDTQPKKPEPKVKKQVVLSEKNTNVNLKKSEEPVNVSNNDFFSDEPKEDEFIVVTKKKNKKSKN